MSMCKAELTVSFASASEAENAEKSLVQETEMKQRARSEISRREKELKLKIEADDPVALRAALNSYLRLIGIIRELAERKNKKEG